LMRLLQPLRLRTHRPKLFHSLPQKEIGNV
jgi:hypothetical protein